MLSKAIKNVIRILHTLDLIIHIYTMKHKENNIQNRKLQSNSQHKTGEK